MGKYGPLWSFLIKLSKNFDVDGALKSSRQQSKYRRLSTEALFHFTQKFVQFCDKLLIV